MIFFAGFVAGVVTGAVVYRGLYTLDCGKKAVVCNESDREKALYRQLERLISYGNDN